MIRFFRKIRSDTLKNSQTGKYVLYAIGEIFLVVLGILIALQINTWNENRQLTIEINNALKEIRSDLEGDSIPIQYVLNQQKQDFDIQKALIDHLESDGMLDSTFNEDFGKVMIMRRIKLVDNGYNTLKSIGMENLKDEDFKRLIIRYYDISKGSVENEIEDDEEEFLTVWRTYLIDHFKDWKHGAYGIPNNYNEISR